jgi:PleD family two-component response regulator
MEYLSSNPRGHGLSTIRGTRPSANDIHRPVCDNPAMVLVVDDDADIANQFVTALQAAGIAARAVYSARAASEAIRRLAPRLVVLGDYLRDMDDVELLTEIRNTGGCELIPILYHTNDERSDRKAVAIRQTTEGFFAKGHCSVDEVVAHIKTQLNHSAPDLDAV